MREIKFRAWDEKYKRMCEVKSFHFGTGKVNVSFRGKDIGLPDRFGGNYNIDANAIMQYIGRKDKNGKEIYEEDIVKGAIIIQVNENDFREIAFKGVVKYKDGYYYVENKDKRNICPFYYPDFWIEILGNKFENPELMNEQT